ncbi:MAG: hypothetical protein ABIB43_00990 [archaeon]
MGIFDFLKKKKIEEETLKFSEVDDWINRKLESRIIREKISTFKDQINQKIAETKQLMKKLEESSLMNENIPERVKQIMKGNRQNYIRKTTIFLDEVNTPEDYLKISDFSKEFSTKLDGLSKETQKSYFVLKEFLQSEVSAVAKKIKEIEDLTIEFNNDIKKKNYHRLEDIKDKLKEYNNSKVNLAALNDEKNRLKEELKVIETKKKIIMNKINDLRVGRSYQEYETLKKDEKTTAEEVQKQKKEIIIHFSTLEKAFRKYKRMSLNEQLIDTYLEGPAEAIMKDENLEITIILEKMLQSIGQLELKDKKEEKTKEEIQKLSREFLKELRDKLKLLIEDSNKIKRKLISNTSAMIISEQESLLENVNQKINEQNKRIEETDNKIERINLCLIKQEVKEILKEFFVNMENE